MSAVETLLAAEAAGVRLGVDGEALIVEAHCAPSPDLIDALRRDKRGILALLSKRETSAPRRFNLDGGHSISRPDLVQCGTCSQFNRIGHPHLGHCAAGEPEAIAGLWDTDHRSCTRWRTLEQDIGVYPHGQ